MIPLYVLALLVHGALSITTCNDGEQIVSQEINNPEELIGNWTYVYHWDNMNEFNREFVEDKEDHELQCPEITITEIAPDFAASKKTECASFVAPFNWADVRLRLDAPLMNMKGGILVWGEKENWLMLECGKMVRVIVKRVSEDYMLMINPEVAHISELIARKVPSLEELKCVAHNVDAGKGMSGFGLCY